ncbi:MAG: HD domain-containing protein [Burkholderiaceae bacterium]
MPLLFSALAFAAEKHRDQKRKGQDASPYINHPIEVARILAAEGGVTDPVTLAAAILHDTVEDTCTTPEELRELFGSEIADVVAEVTDDKTLPKSERKRLQIEHAPHLSERAKRVKLADKIANIRDVAARPPQSWNLERRQQYFDWAQDVVNGLRGTNAGLERVFDQAFIQKPS